MQQVRQLKTAEITSKKRFLQKTSKNGVFKMASSINAEALQKQKVWPGFERKSSSEKSKRKDGKEADATSSNPAMIRAKTAVEDKKKEGLTSESPGFQFECQFRESDLIENDQPGSQKGVKRFKVVMLQEGLGNLKDCYYYTKEALESAVSIFEGKKIYADHPSVIDDSTRPERTVKDIIGHFENVHVEEQKSPVTHMGIGRFELSADVIPIAGFQYSWVNDIFGHALAYAKKYKETAFIGLSINASGESDEMNMIQFLKAVSIPEMAMDKVAQARLQGVDAIRVVKSITDATSCDLVTEAGAGGRILDLIEREKKMGKKVKAKEAHDDAEQDKKLVKSMIKKHLGDTDHDDGDMEMACGMYQAHKEMGDSDDKAAEYAAAGMKMSKHISTKQSEDEKKESAESEDEKEGELGVGKESEDEKKESEDEKKESEDEKKESEDEKKESAKKGEDKIMDIMAENAVLRSRVEKLERDGTIKGVLSESGLSEKAQKLFTKQVESMKSSKEILTYWKKFKETCESLENDEIHGMTTEKVPFQGGASIPDFSDCVVDGYN